MFVGNLVLVAATIAHAVNALPSGHSEHHDHSDRVQGSVPRAWYHPREHPVHELFRRQVDEPSKSTTTAQVGSPAWAAAYPTSTPDVTEMPQSWTDALNAAVAAGKIPNIPPSTMSPAGVPVYPSGLNQDSTQVCSATNRVCKIPGDVYSAPSSGEWLIGFDDGPLPPSQNLYEFLQENNQHATHFFIGVNILQNPDMFLMAYETLQDDIAVHTYTHPYMTTLTNEELVAQFGWTIQIISDSTGGHIPAYWRPPYGDTDLRVHSIAEEIFGLTTILWNVDSSDWELSATPPPITIQQVEKNIQTPLVGSKTPGLIILEHELSNASVNAFINSYPIGKQNGWQTISTLQALQGGDGSPVWQNTTSFPVYALSSSSSVSATSTTASTTSVSSASSTSSKTGTSAAQSSSSISSQNKSQSNGAGRSFSSPLTGIPMLELVFGFTGIGAVRFSGEVAVLMLGGAMALWGCL